MKQSTAALLYSATALAFLGIAQPAAAFSCGIQTKNEILGGGRYPGPAAVASIAVANNPISNSDELVLTIEGTYVAQTQVVEPCSNPPAFNATVQNFINYQLVQFHPGLYALTYPFAVGLTPGSGEM